jgi:replicative DNA helicase
MLNEEQLKIPPHSIEAEQSVLGGLLLDNQAWFNIADRVGEHDFYRRDHQMIFSAIKALAETDKPCDIITLSEWLEQRNLLENVGGLAYLGALARNTPSAANISTYADIVRERSVLRQLVRVGTDIANSAFETQGRTPEELLDEAEKQVFAIAEQGLRKGGFVPIKNLLATAVDRIDELFHKDSPVTGLSTGFADLDDKTSGLQKSDLIIIAGRPSMGKTSFAMNLAENAAIHTKAPVAVFSMEMPGEQLAMRLMSSLGHIDQHKVRTGKLDDEDWPRLTSAISMLADTPLFIDDTPALSPTDLRARARRLAREQDGLGLIVIDYLQLMQVPGNKENRATEVAEISRSLKALAKELNVPVIALSQLNRSLEQRPNKRPVMSDLRESGGLEQDADIIMFIYRDEVYNEDSEDKGTAEIIIAKQRNGPTGTVRLAFLGQYTRFENFASGDFYNNPF